MPDKINIEQLSTLKGRSLFFRLKLTVKNIYPSDKIDLPYKNKTLRLSITYSK